MRTFRAKNQLLLSGTLAAAAALALGMTGCQSEEGEADACLSTDEYFADVYFNTMKSNCASCHQTGGVGWQKSSFKLKPTSEAGYLEANMEVVRTLAKTVSGETSVMLQKPVGGLAHEGGKIIEEGSPEYQKLEELTRRLAEDDPGCPNTQARFLAGVELMSPSETLWKAALVLAARLPTQEEQDAVAKGGFEALDPILDKLMEEEPFYDRLKEKYNDIMHTDFYLQEGIGILGGDGDDGDVSQYDPNWYEDIAPTEANLKKYGVQSGEQLAEKLERYTRTAVAQAPLELVAYVVRHNRPYTEIASADYMVVNPFSAKAYRITDVTFTNDADRYEWQAARIGGYENGYPHAGIMTDPVWLSRHPTTATNRNRHRAKEALFLFLGNDILKAAERPIDITQVQLNQNPTVNQVTCSVCHYAVDPVAGWFRIFQPGEDEDNSQFDVDPEATWHDEMFAPGYADYKMPPDQYATSIQWGMAQAAADPAFAYAGVFMGFRFVIGQEPAVPPADVTDPEYKDDLAAYLGQYYTLSKIATNFREKHGYNFKKMIKELVMSPYFRAKNTAPDIAESQIKHLGAVGTAHLLTPEELERKIERVLGMPWTDSFAGDDGGFPTPNLLSTNGSNGFKLLYGGIDSVDTTKRITTPNGIMANVAERMGLEMGCKLVGAEFSIPQAERRLLKFVEPATEPQDVNGYEIPKSAAEIKANIVYLHSHLLGEVLTATDPEVERTYKLFVDTWREGKNKMAQGGEEGLEGFMRGFPGECVPNENYLTGISFQEGDEVFSEDRLYTGRAWMTVLMYLMTDYKFLYE